MFCTNRTLETKHTRLFECQHFVGQKLILYMFKFFYKKFEMHNIHKSFLKPGPIWHQLHRSRVFTFFFFCKNLYQNTFTENVYSQIDANCIYFTCKKQGFSVGISEWIFTIYLWKLDCQSVTEMFASNCLLGHFFLVYKNIASLPKVDIFWKDNKKMNMELVYT